MAPSSKVLIIGGTGAIGKHVVNASVKLGHPTFVLVRHASPSDSAKAELLKSFKDAGATLVVGDVGDHASLVKAIKQVDVVISTLAGGQVADQLKILDAIKEAGTIKRFLPSEFGNDVDKMEFDIPAIGDVFRTKVDFRRTIENSGVPYTYIVSYCFAGFFLVPIFQDSWTPPREGKLVILGDGSTKAIFNEEADIGTFTIKRIDDPRTENKTLHIRPKENILSVNEVIAKWEKLIGHQFEKEHLDKQAILKSIDESTPRQYVHRTITYSILFKGDQTNFSLNPSKDVEATELYPDVKYTTADAYLSRLV